MFSNVEAFANDSMRYSTIPKASLAVRQGSHLITLGKASVEFGPARTKVARPQITDLIEKLSVKLYETGDTYYCRYNGAT